MPQKIAQETRQNSGATHHLDTRKLARERAWLRALPLIAIAVAALTARLLWVAFLTGTIETEGSEYARLAENLLSGHGYIGLATPGTQLLFPPLYPLLIATLTLVTGQSELAGRLISVAMGTALVPLVYALARDGYDRRIAVIAALFVALHPTLVNLSATVYVESTYITLVLAGTYFVLRLRKLQATRDALLAGFCFGLAYLARLEAIIYPFLAALLMLGETVATARTFVPRVAKQAGLLICTALIVAAPYVAWLSLTTGQFRFEAKSPIIYTIGSSMLAGVNPDELAFGISPDLEGRGIWMQPNLDVFRAHQFKLSDAARHALAQAKHNIGPILSDLTTGPSFGLILFALMILGLFARAWDRELAMRQLVLFAVVGLAGLGGLTHFQIQSRYQFIFLPVMLIWGSAGLVELGQWAGSTARSVGAKRLFRKNTAMTVQCLAGGALLFLALKGQEKIWEFREFDEESRAVKTAGQWLDRIAPGPKTVMETFAILSFHARATYMPFPYADPSTALRYIEKRHVNFIALEEDWIFGRPYLNDWLEHGIPDPRAQLIYAAKSDRIGRIAIYRWSSNAGATNPGT